MLRVQQWRRNKAAAFVASHLVKALLTIWICVSEPCMQIHYKLFKEGQRKHKPNCDNMDILCDLLDPSRSLVGKILDIYVGMLSSSHTLYRDGWAHLYAMEGERWRPEVCAKARASLMSIIGNVWRRLSHYFQQWPWLLIALVSPRGTSATRMRIAKRFMDTPLCCMDAASRQLSFGERLEGGIAARMSQLCQAFVHPHHSQHPVHRVLVRTIPAMVGLHNEAVVYLGAGPETRNSTVHAQVPGHHGSAIGSSSHPASPH